MKFFKTTGLFVTFYATTSNVEKVEGRGQIVLGVLKTAKSMSRWGGDFSTNSIILRRSAGYATNKIFLDRPCSQL